MKKVSLFLPIVSALLLWLSFSCGNATENKKKVEPHTFNDSIVYPGFVRLTDSCFAIDDSAFYPLMLNYVVDFRDIDGEFVVSPAKYYENIGEYESNTKEGVYSQMSAHFELISELGFNTIRVCFDRFRCDDSARYAYYTADRKYYVDNDCDDILDGLSEMLRVAKQNNLRVMLLLKPPFEDQLKVFTQKMLERFSDNPTLFAYDFMNEPLYFDPSEHRDKLDAVSIVASWKKMRDDCAPKQLFTIGFSEPIEAFEWDASILPVDFVQIHTYHPLRVKNEIYWYSRYIGKPWMIGETALPADNDSITYEAQRSFMKEAYEYVRDCGGAGFGWWEFQECVDTHFEAQYTGLMNHEGITKTSSGKEIVGTLKPAVQEIHNFASYKPQEPKRPVNYYNMVGYENIAIKGRILDKETRKPIEGAVIRGWCANWIGMNTYSDENGDFILYCNAPAVHFEISACGMSETKFDQELQYKNISGINYDLNDLPNKNLEYHKISYHPFLKANAADVFDFDAGKFDRYKFEADMGDIMLENIE
ncbi:MAG: hypothetical protein II060_11255 [Bacteroidales bacterium]|nr:hypothetical protein [Bacteroidales bacterium]